jgi:hypothetical protein
MATTYAYELLNPESSEVKDSGVLSYTGSSALTPATRNQVSPVGTITSGALPTVSPSSGTALQVSTARDADLYAVVTADASNNVATCAVALSPDNTTFSTIYTLSLAAAVNNTGAIALVAHARVPAGWYVKLTVVHMTIGTATYA